MLWQTTVAERQVGHTAQTKFVICDQSIDEQGAQWIRWRSQQRDARPAAMVDDMLATSSARASYPDPMQPGRQGKRSKKIRELFPTPTGQTHEEPPVNNGTRSKRHPSKSKTPSTREQDRAETSKERQEPPQEVGWSRPLLYEEVGPDEWGRKEQEHEH